MKQIEVITPITVVKYSELSSEEQRLVDAARAASHRAYAPYSKFRVGAAIALDNGEVITGANQENVAYPSGTCAERSACFYAHAQYPDAKFRVIAIAAVGTDGNELKQPISPCGSCRQALLEYEMLAQGDVKVILIGSEDIYIVSSVKSLLPLAFSEF
ncbi:MAG: cytidine deaminase [Muribaculaceae bacterium]|nr:cytidine deaminase [Muribaculaceae bacterium]MBR3765904.1 cytidine deaminase [Muribaculaceae bacterium]